MATTIAQLTLTSSDLLSDTLELTTLASIVAANTNGLTRKKVLQTAVNTNALVIYTADDFAAPASIYIKNTADYHASNNIVYVYDDTTSGDPVILKLHGGAFAFMPTNADKTLKAYSSTSGTVLESMVIGTDQ